MSKSKPKFKVGDKVRILDGSKIENYAYNWSGKGNPLIDLLLELDESVATVTMDAYIGKICTIKSSVTLPDGRIAYTMKEVNKYRFDERGLEPAGETWFDRPTEESPTFKKFTNNRIEIYREGRNVIAVDKRTGEKAIAKCSPEDEFVFETGAQLAFERLMQSQKYFSGKVVCIKAVTDEFTTGKIYEIKDGVIYSDFGVRVTSKLISSVDELNGRLLSQFVEIVE